VASEQSQVIVWVVALIAVVVAGGIAAAAIKRRFIDHADREDHGAASGGLLEELRAAHARGELTDAQYRAARDKLLAHATGLADRDPGPADGSRAALDPESGSEARREPGSEPVDSGEGGTSGESSDEG